MRTLLIATTVALLSSGTALAQATVPAPSGGGGGAGGKAFNPDMSANFLGLLQHGTALSNSRSVPCGNGICLQEVETQFTADVDPYFHASVLLSIAPSGSGEFGIDPEEVFLETISLPNVTLKAGKFKMALGKHNQLHTHAFPFIDAPLINSALLGDEGLNEAGISGSFLLPTDWYSEVIAQVFNPANTALYNSPGSGDVGALVRLKNLVDLSDDLTMEVGLSGTAGKNAFDQTSTALGADLTFKWRPSMGGKYHALVWQTEYLYGDRRGLTDGTGHSLEKLGGLATWIQYQFAERWWVQGRVERLGMPHEPTFAAQNKQSALVGFFPSEFSGFRLQYDHLTTAGKATDDHTIALQYNVSIGAHPAHAY